MLGSERFSWGGRFAWGAGALLAARCMFAQQAQQPDGGGLLQEAVKEKL